MMKDLAAIAQESNLSHISRCTDAPRRLGWHRAEPDARDREMPAIKEPAGKYREISEGNGRYQKVAVDNGEYQKITEDNRARTSRKKGQHQKSGERYPFRAVVLRTF